MHHTLTSFIGHDPQPVRLVPSRQDQKVVVPLVTRDPLPVAHKFIGSSKHGVDVCQHRISRTQRASGAPHGRRRVARHVREAPFQPAPVPPTGPHRLVAVLLVHIQVLGVVRVPSPPLQVGPGEPVGRDACYAGGALSPWCVKGVAAMTCGNECVAATAWRATRVAAAARPPPRASTPSSRRGHGDNVVSMAWNPRHRADETTGPTSR